MKNFRIIEPEKLKDPSNFEWVEAGIYKDVNDTGGFATHRMAMAVELEEGDDDQYPLEDILDTYLVHVEEFLDNDDQVQQYIFGGDLDSLQNLKSIVGKRAYNEEYVDKEGQTRIRFKIE